MLSFIPDNEQGLWLLFESEGKKPQGHISSHAFDFAGILTSAFLGPHVAKCLLEHIRLESKLMEGGLFTN